MKRFDRLELTPATQPGLEQATVAKSELAAAHDEHHWLRLAVDERRNGHHETALRYYSRALELDRTLIEGWCGQAQMLIALGEYVEAELWSRKALELFKNNASLLAARSQAQTRLGDLKAAQASCDAAIAQPGLTAYPWLARGELMLVRRDPVEQYCFEKATQLDGDWLQLIEIADVYLHHGRPAKAITRLRAAVERAPDHPHCWFRLAACELQLGLTDASRRSLRRCLEVEPKHAEARDQLHRLSQEPRPLRQLLRRLFRRG